MNDSNLNRIPDISLVVSTLGRSAELRRLMESLRKQAGVVFELIIVDQNDLPSNVERAISGEWPFRIRHEHCPTEKGVSRGRNCGLALATASLVAFPDDDCWYPPDFLARGIKTLESRGVQVICGRPTDEHGRTINGRFRETEGDIDRLNCWTSSIEWIQIACTRSVREVGGYDERIGPGPLSPWHSAEGNDLLLRLLASGKRGWYDPTLVGHHAEIRTDNPDAALIRKMRCYARGMGHVLRKHRAGPLECAKWLIRPTGGAIISTLRGRFPEVRMYVNVALGRAEGMLGRVIG